MLQQSQYKCFIQSHSEIKAYRWPRGFTIHHHFHIFSFIFNAVPFSTNNSELSSELASKPLKAYKRRVSFGFKWREVNFKSQHPSQRCRQEAGPRCPQGSCRSYLCRLLMWPYWDRRTKSISYKSNNRFSRFWLYEAVWDDKRGKCFNEN